MARLPLLAFPLPFLGAAAATAQVGGPAPASPGEWWRDVVCYEVFVRSFEDSDGDGVGDLRGLIQRLDYINDGDPSARGDLGAGCIWLMPIAQSPSYHGYDVTNYTDVNRDYGTLAEFRELVREAHRRGIRVVLDLVLNHTSSEHYWFRSAAMDTASPYRDWYLWSDTARVMPGWEAPTWHRNPFRDEYYYGLFWGGMPDLNLANPEVTAEAERIARFWLEETDVDGFRLDAVAHLFERGGQWRNAPAVHPWLREYAAALRRIDPAVFTVGEVMDVTEATAAYYPDQLDAYFMFELADATIEAARSGAGEALAAAVERVQREIPPGRGATLLRNHDQTRTMTELGGDVDRARLAASLLLTLPGIPFVYYGEEIGMTGSKSNGDPRLRTPMQWTRERGVGFTTGLPWEPLHGDSLTANVEAQENDPTSLLTTYRRLIHLRTAAPALARGDYLRLRASAEGAMAFLRRTNGQTVLVIANLGDRALSEVRVGSETGAVPMGEYATRSLLDGPDGPMLRVGRDGRLESGAALPPLAPLETRIFELVRASR